MQDFSLTTGKTLTELTSLTQDTVCGDFNYNAENHLLYEKEWHSIDPNGVIKPSDTQNYFYKDQQLKTDPKYCGKLYWKMCAQVWTSDIESTHVIANDTDKWNGQNAAVFNNTNTIFTYISKAKNGNATGGGAYLNFLATSKNIDKLLKIDVIRKNFNLIKGLQEAKITGDYFFQYSQNKGNNLYFGFDGSGGLKDITGIFGHRTGIQPDGNPLVNCKGGDASIVMIDYSQPENTTDSEDFYRINPNLKPDTMKPQALPLGIGIYAGVATKNSITSTKSAKIIPFMCFCIGITEAPTEA